MESSLAFYVCEHQPSNSPCPECHPRNSPTMPADWLGTYTAPTDDPGMTDATNI